MIKTGWMYYTVFKTFHASFCIIMTTFDFKKFYLYEKR